VIKSSLRLTKLSHQRLGLILWYVISHLESIDECAELFTLLCIVRLEFGIVLAVDYVNGHFFTAAGSPVRSLKLYLHTFSLHVPLRMSF